MGEEVISKHEKFEQKRKKKIKGFVSKVSFDMVPIIHVAFFCFALFLLPSVSTDIICLSSLSHAFHPLLN